jgi:type IV secretory pathway VirD2 relaxase
MMTEAQKRNQKRTEQRRRAKARVTCEGKRSYDSRKQARIAAERTTASTGVKMDFYRCLACGSHHVGGKRKDLS